MKRLLVHICCGPCSIYPIKQALKGEVEVTGFFFNPNIQPRGEFNKRLDSVRKLAALMELDIVYKDEYDTALFLKDREGRQLKRLPKEDRCEFCYSTRLEATALAARDGGFDSFTSSLLYSRYQEHEKIIEIAGEYAEEYGVGFFYEDFRVGWQKGITESKDMGL
ncbi:MAG: epoxyqueuosine reductase QueH, partial [Thermodesulfobacteriota bacterium]